MDVSKAQDGVRAYSRELARRAWPQDALRAEAERYAQGLGLAPRQIPADVRALWQPAQGTAAAAAARGQAASGAAAAPPPPAADPFAAMLAAHQQQAQLLAAQQPFQQQLAQMIAAAQQQRLARAAQAAAPAAPAAPPAPPQHAALTAAQIVQLRQRQLELDQQRRAAKAASKAAKQQRQAAAYPAPLPAGAAAAAVAAGADQEVELEAEDGQAAVRARVEFGQGCVVRLWHGRRGILASAAATHVHCACAHPQHTNACRPAPRLPGHRRARGWPHGESLARPGSGGRCARSLPALALAARAASALAHQRCCPLTLPSCPSTSATPSTLGQYAEYAAVQVRKMHPGIMGHPGGRRGRGPTPGRQPGHAQGVGADASAPVPRGASASFQTSVHLLAQPPLLKPLLSAPGAPPLPPADPLVETASLASVPLPPIDPGFRHALGECVERRLLSDAQLETVVRGCWVGRLSPPPGMPAHAHLRGAALLTHPPS